MKKDIEVEFWSGQLLEVFISEEEIYVTQIVEKEKYLLIQIPKTKMGVPITVDGGQSVTINFYDDVQGMCTFDSRIVQLENGQLIIKKPLPGAIKRIQRRRFFRIDTAVKMQLTLLSEDEDVEGEMWDLYTHDISGGGLSFLREDKPLEIDDIVKGTIEIQKEAEVLEVTFTAKVVNVLKQVNNYYKTSLEFQEITEGERTEVIRYCMFKQVELRKKIGKR